MIPTHPQTVPGRPGRLRWIIPAGTLTGTGAPADVPAPLAALLADGTLTRITVEPAAVVTHLAPGRTWAAEGARVRSALHAALEEPAAWIAAPDPGGSGEDALLYAAAQEVLAGEVGDFARSHGGTIDLVDAVDGVVTVRLGGACHGCPASWFTLHRRLEDGLRRRHPALREVRGASSPGVFR
ncbi:NifU family protein [Streptomyces sp. NPDC088106]|uniref:NifU family protein n=1 Tax=Streptomyces TaxID=1883 RepID=UPI0034021677